MLPILREIRQIPFPAATDKALESFREAHRDAVAAAPDLEDPGVRETVEALFNEEQWTKWETDYLAKLRKRISAEGTAEPAIPAPAPDAPNAP